MVASAGGHLTQLVALTPRLRFRGRPVIANWVTYPGVQAESLGAGYRAAYHPTTRNVKNAVLNARLAARLIAEIGPDVVISTGAGIAVPFLAAAAARRVPNVYIESATRLDGPSLSGRILELFGRRLLLSQHPWGRAKWEYRGSVFNGYEPFVRVIPRVPVKHVLVSLGTHSDYPFPRLVEAVVRVLPAEIYVTWQLGSTALTKLPGVAFSTCSVGAMAGHIARADVVIAHAGTGIALSAVQAGHMPLLCPRDAARGEHVDNHQQQTARFLEAQGLAQAMDPDILSWDAVESVARRGTRSASDAPTIPLD